ncbi:MAG: hypothetical protein RJA81_1311, partial [Planctomycetota bacterium]
LLSLKAAWQGLEEWMFCRNLLFLSLFIAKFGKLLRNQLVE